MKAKPIIFNAESVRSILDGRKTQTRRPIRGPGNVWHIDQLLGEWPLSETPRQWDGEKYPWRWRGKREPQLGDWIWEVQTDVDDSATWPVRCPYGQPDDLLWVRETQWCSGGYVATDKANFENEGKIPSIFMRRVDSRITLLVKRAWTGRVQDISLHDAIQEGYPDYAFPVPEKKRRCALISKEFNVLLPQVRKWFVQLWDSINAKCGFGWEVNPFVWCREFEVAE